jgi:MFS family permease
MPPRPTGLSRHPDFLKFWAGQTISLFGSNITYLALPLTAILLLDATPGQMGILTALEFAPFLLFGLLAGAWVDRLPRRPILIATNVGSALLVASIPIAALAGVLRIEQLYVVGFLTGTCKVLFDVAYMPFLTFLVGREHLVEGNSKMETTSSIAQITGPGLAGALIEALTAPVAIAADALSFLVSALMLGTIRAEEPVPPPRDKSRSILGDIKEGLAIVARNPFLRAIAGAACTSNIFDGILSAVYLLYITEELGVASVWIGIIFGVGSVGGLLASLLGQRAVRRFGLGTVIIAGMVLGGVSLLLLPLAGTLPLGGVVILLLVLQWLRGFGIITYNINAISLRQGITPDALQGRVNATGRVIAFSSLPVGALIGGALGGQIGLGPTVVIAAAGSLLSVLWLFFSPIRFLREQPPPLAWMEGQVS